MWPLSTSLGLLPSAQRYHLEQLLTPRDFFYPRVAMDFYQSMTTHHVRDPSVIHFTIDGRHGILGARHIAEALRIPYEPARPEDYRVWTNPSPSDIVRILSRGASTGQYLQRRELPPSMFFIDALLRHNIFPLRPVRGSKCYEHLMVVEDMNDFGALKVINYSGLWLTSMTLGQELKALDAKNSSCVVDDMNESRSCLKALDAMNRSGL
ncbi:hypothetical protein AAG906_003071 [Vitis piasezkii]